MNYDQPRQIAEGEHAGKWQYTTANRRTGTHPIGFCWAPGPDSDPNDASTWPEHYHETELEARECYAEYRRDNVRLDKPHSWSWGTCDFGREGTDGEPCENPANNGAHSGAWSMALLCDTHFNMDDAITAMGLNKPAGDSIHS